MALLIGDEYWQVSWSAAMSALIVSRPPVWWSPWPGAEVGAATGVR